MLAFPGNLDLKYGAFLLFGGDVFRTDLIPYLKLCLYYGLPFMQLRRLQADK